MSDAMTHNVHPQLAPLLVPIDSLELDPRNAREHDERNIESVMLSYAESGQRKPIVVKLPERIIEAGNCQLEAARRLGWTHIAALLVDEDERSARKFALRDNRTAELAQWDLRQLAFDLREMKEAGEELEALGWTGYEAEPLLVANFTPAKIDPDYKAPGAEAKWLDDELAANGWSLTAAQREAILEHATKHGVPNARAILRAIVWSQWDTEPELAAKMVELALTEHTQRRRASLRVLEPSAGRGAIVRAIRERAPKSHITAHEIDPQRVELLRSEAVADEIVAGDFLAAMGEGAPPKKRPFDISIQNTPYENGLDGLFLERTMMLCDAVTALLRTNALHGKDRHARVWSRIDSGEWGVRALRYLASRPDFESIIADGSARSDFVIVQLVRGFKADASVRWW